MKKHPLLYSLRDYIQKTGMISTGERIIVAVSGGIDSMVLLDVLHAVRSEFSLTLAIGHCNHQLRGNESDEDEAFVRSTAQRYGIECYIEQTNTAKIADTEKKSLQETARELRYAFLQKLRSSSGFNVIATAHHADDNTETMLFNMFRGAGVQGLSGIPAMRKDACIIRPLLFATRNDIASYAQEQDIQFREDSSNANPEYTRNYLRHTLIPSIREHINPNLTATLQRTSELFNQLEEYIEEESKKVVGTVVIAESKEEIILDLGKFHLLQIFLQEYLLQQFAKRIAVGEIDFGSVKMLHRLSRGATGSSLTLGNTVSVYKDRDRLIMTTIRPAGRYEHPIELNKRHEFNTFSFESTTVDHADMTGNPSVEYIDSSFLGKNLMLRSWQEGDWFIPLGMSTKKKISDFFIDAKVPVFEKNSIPLLVSDDQIVWVCGKRLDNRFKVTPSTRSITKLEYLPRS